MLMRDVVETIASPSGQYKVEIARRDDGYLQVFLMRWIEEIVPEHGKVAEFWEDQGRTASITDDIEVARSIGLEYLTAHDPAFVPRR
jgi:hypothetical protein